LGAAALEGGGPDEVNADTALASIRAGDDDTVKRVGYPHRRVDLADLLAAVYLELALRLGVPLATSDKALIASAEAVAVVLLPTS
jgi:hypothetical protein